MDDDDDLMQALKALRPAPVYNDGLDRYTLQQLVEQGWAVYDIDVMTRDQQDLVTSGYVYYANSAAHVHAQWVQNEDGTWSLPF